jgi:hypothetical protein
LQGLFKMGGLCVSIAKRQMLICLWSPFDLWLRKMINGKIWILGPRLIVVTSFKASSRMLMSLSSSSSLCPSFCFWSVYPKQGCDDILSWMFCHNSFGGALSLIIQTAITSVWSFIIMFTYKSSYYLIIGLFPWVTWHVDKSSIGG